MKVHTHFWLEKRRDSGGVYYECECGASKLVSTKEAKDA